MEEFLIQLIKMSALSWVITQWLQLIIIRFIPILIKMICFKCIFFWLTLIITQDIYMAAVTSFMGYILDLKLTTSKTTLL